MRGDHAEVVQLLMQLGGKVRATSGALVDLQTTPLSRSAAFLALAVTTATHI